MAEDDELCGVVMYQAACDLPAGHPGEFHHSDVGMPAELGQLVELMIQNLEREKAAYRRLRSWCRWVIVCCGLATATMIYIVLSAVGGQ